MYSQPTAISIHDIVWYQKQHDSHFHQDIAYLPLMKRMSHLTHHLNKYVSAIDNVRDHLYEDLLATVISMAGALNMSLSKHLSNIYGARITYITEVTPLYSDNLLIQQLKLHISHMSKTIEGFDHLEAIQYRQEMETTTAQLFLLALQLNHRTLQLGGSNYQAVFKIDSDVEKALFNNHQALNTIVFINYHKRLQGIRLKNPFYQYIVEGMMYSGRHASAWANTFNRLSRVYLSLHPFFGKSMPLLEQHYAVPLLEINEL